MLRFTASKLLIRNLDLLKGTFWYSTGETGSVYSNPSNQLKNLGMTTEEMKILAYYFSKRLTLKLMYQSNPFKLTGIMLIFSHLTTLILTQFFTT